MTTMADVARAAGVSVTTVSHVVNGTRAIRSETRERVEAAIAATGFVVNTLARSLATSTTATVGLSISALSNFYFSDLVARIDDAVRDAGCTLLLADPHEDAAAELAIVRSLHGRRVDGILIAPVTGRDGPALDYLRSTRMPTVLIDRCAADDFDQIGVENIESTAGLTAHLAQVGHRRIGMVSGVATVQTTHERIAGFRKALHDSGIEFCQDLVVSGRSDAAGAADAVDRLLSLPDPPTALVIANNHMTIGALRALQRRGLRVPDDIALTTFDDFDWADVFSPHLTAIAQPIDRIAARGVEMLFERLAGYDGPPRTERPAGIWQHRDSCGCVGALR